MASKLVVYGTPAVAVASQLVVIVNGNGDVPDGGDAPNGSDELRLKLPVQAVEVTQKAKTKMQLRKMMGRERRTLNGRNFRTNGGAVLANIGETSIARG